MTWKCEQPGRYSSGAYTIRRTWNGEEPRWVLRLDGVELVNAPTLAGAKRFAARREGAPVERTDRPCTSRRCNDGVVTLASGMPTTCMTCMGTGRVPSAADQFEIDSAQRRGAELLAVLRARCEVRDGRRNGDIQFEADSGLSLLREREPHRVAKLLDSIEGGRVDAVIDALRVYFEQHAATVAA